MKRRRKKERGFGGTILRLVLVLALAAGAWFAWAKYRGTPVDLPDWASLEKIGDIASRSKQTTSPGITATNPPPVIPPAPYPRDNAGQAGNREEDGKKDLIFNESQ